MKIKPKSLPTAVTYCRVSDREQKNGLSLDSQHQFIKSFCDRNKISVLKEFSEITTGTKFDRKELNSLKDFCKKRKPTYMLVWRWDRLGRNAIEMLSIVKDFKGTGTEINAVEQWKEGDTADDKFMLQLQAILAERESNITSERTQKNMRFGMEQGYWLNKVPLGYRRSNILDERGKRPIELCPVGAPIVREIFTMFLGGTDKMAIRTHIIAKHKQDLQAIGYSFVKMAIRRVLSNPFYLGKLALRDHNGEIEKWIDAKHPSVIEQSIFDAAQRKLEELEGKHGRPEHVEHEEYPLKGSFFCPHCFVPLRAYKVKKTLRKSGNVQEISYYDCKDNHFRINTKSAHDIMNAALSELSISENSRDESLKYIKQKISDMLSEIKTKQTRLQKERDELQMKITKLDDLLLNGLALETYERLLKQLQKELQDKAFELSDLVNVSEMKEKIFNDAVKMLTDLGEGYINSDGITQRKLIKALFPCGFFIDKKDGIVLTLFLNSFVSLIRSESIKYERLRLIKSEEVSFRSPKVTIIEPKKPNQSDEIARINDYICTLNTKHDRIAKN